MTAVVVARALPDAAAAFFAAGFFAVEVLVLAGFCADVLVAVVFLARVVFDVDADFAREALRALVFCGVFFSVAMNP